MPALLLPGKPVGKRSRNYIIESLFGIERPFLCRSACGAMPTSVGGSGGSEEHVRMPASCPELVTVCGWCGCTRRCGCEELIEACKGGASLFENLQLESSVMHEKLEDCCAASVDTMSVLDSIECSSATSVSGSSEDLARTAGAVEDSESEDSVGDDAARALPDFSGHWVFRRYEGDFDAMMQDAGTHWSIRRLARAANYGVNMISQDIRHHGDDLVVAFNAGTSVNRMILTVGEADQATVNEAGEPSVFNAAWEGAAIFVAGVRVADGARLQGTLRYMQGQEMVVETRLSSGALVRRFYTQ